MRADHPLLFLEVRVIKFDHRNIFAPKNPIFFRCFFWKATKSSELSTTPPNFDIMSSGLLSETDNLLVSMKELCYKIVSSVTPSTATFFNVLQPLIDHESASLCRLNILTLFVIVSVGQETRDASRVAENLVNEANTEAFMDRKTAVLMRERQSNRGRTLMILILTGYISGTGNYTLR